MPDPRELYEVAGELPVFDRPVLVHALTGFVDAGAASELAADHLLKTCNPRRIVRFDIDQMYDYRSRRPPMVFVEDHWAEYEEPRLELHVLSDDARQPFLLLAGCEPDLRWERFIAAVVDLVRRFGVRLTVGLNAIPMAVPHTRPVGITAHANRRELISGYRPWLHRVQVPASTGNLLEYRLGQQGLDAVGFAAHVPQYTAQTGYPAAAEELLASVSRATGLLLPVHALRGEAESVRVRIDEQLTRNDEVAAAVRELEAQYDAFMRDRESEEGRADSSMPLPTGEELGAELERFLSEQPGPHEPPQG